MPNCVLVSPLAGILPNPCKKCLSVRMGRRDRFREPISANRTSRGRIGLLFFPNGYSVDDFEFNGLPDGNRFRMVLTAGKCGALPNDNFATATNIPKYSEVGIDLPALRHPAPRIAYGISIASFA